MKKMSEAKDLLAPETREFLAEYAERSEPKFAVESLAYLCRSDKLNETEIPFLANISNSAFQASEQFSHLPELPYDARSYRMGEVYFKDCNHRDLEREVIALLESVLLPEEPAKSGFISQMIGRLCK